MKPNIEVYLEDTQKFVGGIPERKELLIIPPKLVEKCYEFIGEKGVNFFKKIKKEQGRIDGILKAGDIPYPIHFREGMQIRNFMRQSGLCKGWSDHDYDNNWVHLVECVLSYDPPIKKKVIKWSKKVWAVIAALIGLALILLMSPEILLWIEYVIK